MKKKMPEVKTKSFLRGKKNFKEDLSKWRQKNVSFIERVNIVKMSVLSPNDRQIQCISFLSFFFFLNESCNVYFRFSLALFFCFFLFFFSFFATQAVYGNSWSRDLNVCCTAATRAREVRMQEPQPTRPSENSQFSAFLIRIPVGLFVKVDRLIQKFK